MEIKNFEYILNKQNIRVILIDNEPWFVGLDICRVLGYSNARDALSTHVDKEDKNTVAIHDGTPGNPNKTIINEAGLYSLIFSSKQDKAKNFKCWITREVLPTIRKTGKYEDKENKFENLCPVEFGQKELTEAMRKNCKAVGGRKNGGLAWYFKYIAFGNKIGIDFYYQCKKQGIRPVTWLRNNNFYEEFCKFVCT